MFCRLIRWHRKGREPFPLRKQKEDAMRALRNYGIMAVFGLVWGSILLAGAAISPGYGLLAAVLMALLAYAVWVNGVAVLLITGMSPLQPASEKVPRIFGFVAAAAGLMMLLEHGIGATVLIIAVAGALPFFLCMPILNDARGVYQPLAQPLALVTGFILFTLSLHASPPQFGSLELALTGWILCASILGMWLWLRLVGQDAPASIQLLSPIPALLVSFALFASNLPVTAYFGALCLAWGFSVITRPEIAATDVARTITLNSPETEHSSRIAA